MKKILKYCFFCILFSVLAAKEKPPINVVGDVGGRIAIMVVSKTLLFIVIH